MSTSAWASAASPVVAIRTPRVNRVRRFPGARDPNTNGAVAVTAASNGTPEATTTHEKTCSEGARDETTDDGTGGKDWWSSGIEWTKKWALGDSDSESDPDPDDDDDAVAHDDSRDFTSTANIVESVLDRVPLPPWLRDTVNNVLTKETSRASETSGEGETREASETSGSASWTSSSSASTDTTSPAHPESIKGVSKTAVATVGNWKTNPLENMEAFAEALDEGHLVGDGTVHNRTEAIAASATKEAVEKLEDALLAVEGAARSANSARETLEGFGKSVGESTETSTKNTKLDQELQLALQVARLRADEARVASAALGVAASDVQKAREAMRLGSVSEGALDRESGSETDTQRKLRLRGAFGAAGDRLLAASAASRAAAAAASASLKQVAFFEDEDTRGVDIKTSAVKTSGVNNAQRRKKLQRSFEAVEIAGAVSRVAEWSVNQFAKPTPVEISDAVQPALARVVAQSLEPSSPGDLRHARVACGLAAWIYYLPTAHKSLAKFGLRMVVSSLDNADGTGAAGTEKANSQYEEPFASKDEEPFASKALASEYFTKTETKASRKQTDEMARKAIDAADAALLELARLHDGKSREDEKGHGASVASAREASKLAQRVSQLMRPQDPDEKRNNITAVSKKQAENVSTITKLPVAFAVAVDDTNGALWISIEGSTSLASWQTNLTFQPVPFEDPKFDVRVHRGSYDCAKVLLAQVEGAVTEHVKRHGESARIHITGHSLGGSIAMVLAMMLLVRNVAPKEAFADVWTFGSPYVLCGGDKLLKKLGLPRTFVKSVAMGKDIVPRSFSCYYPWWVRRALEMAPGSLRVNTETQPSFLEEEMFFAPMGDMWMLQAMHGSAHPLLPPGPGLYKLSGDGLFEQIAQRVESVSDRIDIVTDDDLSDVWLDRRTRAGWGETFWDDNDGSDGVIPMPDTGDVSMTDQNVSAKKPEKRSRLHRLACLTQHDASLTASLILGSVDTNGLDFDFTSNKFGKTDLKVLLQEKGRDAARRVVLNTPHPLTVLSDPKAYGNAGSISRHHNPFNYLRALGKTRRVWEEGSQPTRNGVADLLFGTGETDGGTAR